MNIAIIHYHCRPGGVGRVVESAVRALAPHGVRAAVLTGEAPPTGGPDVGAFRVVPWLAYGEEHCPADAVGALADAAADALGGRPDVWHFHNHSLGKNLTVPLAAEALALAGERVLLQIHDFAEDGRPAEYAYLRRGFGGDDGGRLGRRLYRASGSVHFAVLNARDRAFLRGAGAPAERLHELPNPVTFSAVQGASGTEPPEGPGGLMVYVTRAIRRKNVGEFLLWAALAGEGERFAITRGPANPAQRPAYERWKALAREMRLPVEFEATERPGATLAALMQRANWTVTTSVAEGFGLAFLEPWLANRPVAGRNLPDITQGFATEGVDLSHLYGRLEVPVAWIGEGRLRRTVEQAMRRSWQAYGRRPGPGDFERAIGDIVREGRADFGRLDEEMQEAVVRRLAGSAQARRDVRPASLPPTAPPPRLVESNRRAVAERFSLEKYGRRLAKLYEDIAGSEPGEPAQVDGEALLDSFMAPERFCLLRT